MADKYRIRGDQLGAALQEALGTYSFQATERINAACEETMKEFVRITKQIAPRRTNKYQKAIAYQLKEKKRTGNIYVWCPKPPYYRLTHLIVHGHRTRKGSRTRANDFLEASIDEVQPRFDARLEAAIKGDRI